MKKYLINLHHEMHLPIFLPTNRNETFYNDMHALNIKRVINQFEMLTFKSTLGGIVMVMVK